MTTKVIKKLKIAAATVFVLGLAINVYMTLNQPFSTVDTVLIAQQTGTGTKDGGELKADGSWCLFKNKQKNKIQCMSLVRVYYKDGIEIGVNLSPTGTIGGTISGGITYEMEYRPGTKIICVAGGYKCCRDIIGDQGWFSNEGDCVAQDMGTSKR